MSYLTQVSGQGFQTVYAFPQKVPGIKQEKVMECGCCCVGLVLRMAKYGGADQITPEMLREESQKYEGAYRPSPGDVIPGVKPEGLGPAMELLKEGMDEARRHGLPSNGPQHLGSTFSNMKKMLRREATDTRTQHTSRRVTLSRYCNRRHSATAYPFCCVARETFISSLLAVTEK